MTRSPPNIRSYGGENSMSVDKLSDGAVQRETRAWAEQAAALRARLRSMARQPGGSVELVTPGAALAPRIAGVAASTMGANVSLEPPEKPLIGAERELETAAFLGQALLDRGLTQRIVRGDLLSTPEDLPLLEQMAAAGVAGRFHPGVPMRILGFDGTVAFVAVDPDNTRAGGFVVRDVALVAECYALFEEIWERAVVPTAWGLYDQASLGTEQHVLQLLLSGLKDEAIGRRLGISDRTVRRIVAELQREFQATSRVHLAALAAHSSLATPGEPGRITESRGRARSKPAG